MSMGVFIETYVKICKTNLLKLKIVLKNLNILCEIHTDTHIHRNREPAHIIYLAGKLHHKSVGLDAGQRLEKNAS